MLKIKLVRFGKRSQPHYRIVVNEARDKRDGNYVEKIGHYAPTQTPKTLEINLDLYQKWIDHGAQPTDTVAALVKKYKSKDPFPQKKQKLSKKAKAKLEAGKTAKVEADQPANKSADQPAAPITTSDQPQKEDQVQSNKETDEKSA